MGYETLLYLYKDDIINVWENKHIYLTNTNIDYCNINLFSSLKLSNLISEMKSTLVYL